MVVVGGGGVSSMLITELSTYVPGSKDVLLSARCKTEVGPRWFCMLPHSRVTVSAIAGCKDDSFFKSGFV